MDQLQVTSCGEATPKVPPWLGQSDSGGSNMFHWTYFHHGSLLVGGFNNLEKYESQWERLSHILWKIKTVPNHQPD